jgi:hypothetical protein
MKNSMIFLMQAFIVSIITVLLGAEAYLYYKREIEKPVQFECPTVRCPDCIQSNKPMAYAEEEPEILPLVCIGKNLYTIDDQDRLLKDKNGNEILCFNSEEIQSITGFNLFVESEK